MLRDEDGLPTGRWGRAHARRLTDDEVAACRGWLAEATAGLPRGARRTLRYILVITEERRLDWNRLARREIRHYTGLSESGQDKALRDVVREKRLLQARPTEEKPGDRGPNEYRLACLDHKKGDEASERDGPVPEALAANAAHGPRELAPEQAAKTLSGAL